MIARPALGSDRGIAPKVGRSAVATIRQPRAKESPGAACAWELAIATRRPDPTTQLIAAYVVPTDRGALLFTSTEYATLEPRDGPFQLAVYSPYALSPGELAVLRSRFEADLFAYASQAVQFGGAWKRRALVAALELGILGLAVAFLLLNASRMAFIIGWALPIGLLGATVQAAGAYAHRAAGQRARALLDHGVVSDVALEGRMGESLAYVRNLWRALDRGAVARELGALEEAARTTLNWPVGAAFYREVRADRDEPSAPRGRLRRSLRSLVGAGPAPVRTVIEARTP